MSDTAPLAAGARVAGLVVSLGYLTGLVPGPLVAAFGGLALITYGRCLELDRKAQAASAAGLAVVAGAAGIASLRWGTLELEELRAVQAVLGPTILVGAAALAVAAISAAAAALVALALWLAARPAQGVTERVWSGAETGAMGLAVVSAFWGPKVVTGAGAGPLAPVLGLGAWLLALILVAAAAAGCAVALSKVEFRWRAAVLAGCGVVVVAAAAVTGVAT